MLVLQLNGTLIKDRRTFQSNPVFASLQHKCAVVKGLLLEDLSPSLLLHMLMFQQLVHADDYQMALWL